MRGSLRVRLVPALFSGLLISAVMALPAQAAEIVTPFPGVAVEPGQTATFDLTVHSDARERVGLRVAEAPDGWTTLIRGGGNEIDAVYTDPDSPAQAQVEVQVPADAPAGTQRVTVEASAGSGDSTLALDLRVVEHVADAFELTTEFPTLQGSNTDTFRFDLTLANHTAQEASFQLAASGPEGWTVEANPSTEQQAATLTVDAGATATIAVEADPPDDVEAGTYELAVAATGEGTTLEAPLAVEVAGSTSFTLATSDERLNASGSAGSTGTLSLVIRNDGNAPLQGIELDATPPTDWDVSFDPATIQALGPGETGRVTARITPSDDAIAGDYVVTLTASSGGTSEEVEIRYAVETSGWWGLLGILVIAAAVAALVTVYRRYGRR